MAAKLVTSAPYVLFVAVTVGFVAWLFRDSLKLPSRNESRDAPPSAVQAMPGPMGVPADDIFDNLQLGSPRVVVERQFSSATPFAEPVDMSTGAPVLRTRVRVQVSRYRPELMKDIPESEFQPGTYRLILEFAGEVDRHPLRSIKIMPLKP